MKHRLSLFGRVVLTGLIATVLLTWDIVYNFSAAGLAYLLGQIIGVLLFIGVPVGLIWLWRRLAFPWTGMLTLCLIVALSGNVEKIIGSIDLIQFQSELKVAGPNHVVETIQKSQTAMGTFFRHVIESGEAVQKEIAPVLDQVSDPVFENLLAPPKITDRAVLQRAYQTALAKQEKVDSALKTVDEALARALAKISVEVNAFQGISGQDRRESIANAKNSLDSLRALYARQINLNQRFLKAVVSLCSFLLNEAGPYEESSGPYKASSDQRLIFATQDLADQYNDLLAVFKAISEEHNQLNTDYDSYARSQKAPWSKLARQ
jgi:hypothetical protein